MNFNDYLNEKSSVSFVSIDIIWKTRDRIKLSYGVIELVSRVFPYSVNNSFRINPISSYIDNLSSSKRLRVAESILKELK